jgi:uncharacterized protein YjdB
MRTGARPAGTTIRIENNGGKLSDSKLTGDVFYKFAGNVASGNPTGETALTGAWSWPELAIDNTYASAGAVLEDASFAPYDKRIAQYEADGGTYPDGTHQQAKFCVFDTATLVQIPDSYVIEGVQGTTLADIDTGKYGLDGFLKQKGFRGLGIGTGAAIEIPGAFSWQTSSAALSATGGTQQAIIVFRPAAEITEGGIQDYDPEDGARYMASAATVEIRLVKPALAGTAGLSGTAQCGEELVATAAGLELSPDVSESVGFGGVSYLWKRYDGPSDLTGHIIGGAATETYTLGVDDVGKQITVTLTAANASGSVESARTETVEKPAAAAPGRPALLSKTESEVILIPMQGVEFSHDGETWQESSVFTGLEQDTVYVFTARFRETGALAPSEPSEGLAVRTDRVLGYAAAQSGGTPAVETTERITLDFDEAVDQLAQSDVVVEGLSGAGVYKVSGSLAEVEDSGGLEWTVDIGGDFTDGDVCAVRISPLAASGTKYDAAPRQVVLYRDVTGPLLTNVAVERVHDSSTAAILSLTVEEDCEVYYMIFNAGAKAPSKEAVALLGTPLGLITRAFTGERLTLTAAAHDVYVVARDGEGNICEPVKASVGAYGDGDDSGPSPAPAPGSVKVQSLKITGAPKLFRYKASGKGNTLQLKAVASPSNAANKAVTWRSGSPTLATVDQKGRVKFKGGEGIVTITATAKDGSRCYAIAAIKVARNVTKIRTVHKKLYIKRGKKLKLPVALDDKTKPGKKITSRLKWKSSKPKVLKVTKTGVIKASKKVKKRTKVKVSVTAYNGKKLTWTVYVVPKAKKLKKATVKFPKKARMKKGKFYQIKVKLKSSKATGVNITFKSSKPKVIYVDKAGRLWAKKKGKATITVKVGKKKYKKKIRVR